MTGVPQPDGPTPETVVREIAEAPEQLSWLAFLARMPVAPIPRESIPYVRAEQVDDT